MAWPAVGPAARREAGAPGPGRGRRREEAGALIALELAAVVSSLLVLGAHFLRAGAPLLTLAAIGLLGLLAVRRPWAARTIQVVLVLGALEWLRTLVRLAAARIEAGEPMARMVAILGIVAAVAVLGAIALSRGRLAERYGLLESAAEDSETEPG